MAGTSQNPTKHRDYEGFVEKFKPRKTTDDCYTPPQIYSAVRDWACAEYDINPSRIVRPFYPGGDYERYEYPGACVVLDNPPFSCLAAIRRFYQTLGIDYFLFAPELIMLNCKIDDCCICAGISIEYENGAKVNTGFVTSLDLCIIRSAPKLRCAIEDAQKRTRAEKTRAIPSYDYPDAVVTAAMCERYSKYGVEFQVEPSEAVKISALDEQRAHGKTIFGSGLLVSKAKAAERAAAERIAAERAAEIAAERAAEERSKAQRWSLSERERELQATLD